MAEMKKVISDFLQALDDHLANQVQPGDHLDLYQLGGAVMVMHYESVRVTKDFDVVDLPKSLLMQNALATFGKETKNARELGLYLDAVNPSLPPLPSGYQSRSEEITGNWKVIRLWKLDPYDLIISKIRVFRTWDQADIRHLLNELEIRGQPLNPSILRERFNSAFLWYTEGDSYRDDAMENLERVIKEM